MPRQYRAVDKQCKQCERTDVEWYIRPDGYRNSYCKDCMNANALENYYRRKDEATIQDIDE